MTTIKHASITFIFLLALTITDAQAETALHNINGYTSTNEGIQSFTVLIFDDAGRVSATGDEELLNSYPDASLMDGNGRTVLPGLTDAHAHVLGLGLLKSNLDLLGSTSVQDAVERIRRYAASKPNARWILGRGWNQVIWPTQEFPSAKHIDAVVSDRPVWLRRVDGHAGWANSVALGLAGIDDETPDPVGGKIIRDANGHATGVLVDMAMGIMGEQVPATNKDEMRDAIQSAIRALLAEGVTGVHDAGIDLMGAEVYLSMADNKQLDIRIYAMIGGAGDVLDAIAQPIRQYGNDRLEIAAVKLYADGALGSRGAAMIEPYSDDDENRGLPFWTQQELDSGAVLANGSDFPVELSNPFHGLYAAVTRQGRDGEPDGGWYADQALTRAEALHSFTLAAAFAANQEDRLGSLEPGKWADFIVIDRDYFEIPSSEIDDIKVLQTWVGGKLKFTAENTGDAT